MCTYVHACVGVSVHGWVGVAGYRVVTVCMSVSVLSEYAKVWVGVKYVWMGVSGCEWV